MAKIEGGKHEGGVVDIDGHEFHNTHFVDCEIRYSGGGPPSFVGCKFERCTLGLGGAAANTIGYLGAIYTGFGKWGSDSVDALFDQIRSGEK